MATAVATRRSLLARGALVTWVASSGVLTVSACSGSKAAAAYSPWALWNDPAAHGTPLALVAAGVLAANPHDSQPWLFHVAEDAIEVFADTSRHLGAMDPMLREMHIGLGCAIENMCVAAGPNGYRAAVETIPGDLAALKDRRGRAHAATIRLARLAAPSQPTAAYGAIPRRHTNRHPYDRGRPLPEGWRKALLASYEDQGVKLFVFETGPPRRAFEAVVLDATQALIDDTAMIADSDRWLRRSDADIARYRSGPTLEAAGLSPMTLAAAKLLPVSPQVEHKAWLTHTRDDQLATAPLTGLIAVRDRFDRAACLAVGQVWQRLHLAATAAGVALQPLNQPMEMADRDRQLGREPAWERRLSGLVGSADWRPTFSFRAGIATRNAGPSPRRALRDVLTSST